MRAREAEGQPPAGLSPALPGGLSASRCMARGPGQAFLGADGSAVQALGNPLLLPGDPELRRAEEEAARTAKQDIAAFLEQVKARDEALAAAAASRPA